MAKITAKNSALPPLKYNVIDSYSFGDNKYELRELRTGVGIYLYSNRTRQWTVYRKHGDKLETEQKWSEMKDRSYE